MKKWFDSLSAIIIAFWVGGLWITSLWVYVLFQTLSDRALAGQLAGDFFSIMSNIGLYAGCFLLALRFFKNGFQALNQVYFWAVVAMLSLILATQYSIQPEMESLKQAALPLDVMSSSYAEKFKLWHGLASVVYMVECVLGFIVVTKRLA